MKLNSTAALAVVVALCAALSFFSFGVDVTSGAVIATAGLALTEEAKSVIAEGLLAMKEKVRAELQAAIEKYEGQVAENGKASTEAKAEVKALSEKFEKSLNDITQKLEKADGGDSEPVRSLGKQFVSSDEFKALASGQKDKVRVEVKNTVVSDSTTVFAQQNPGVIAGDFLPLTIRQILTSVPVSSNSVESLRENTWTNSAAEVSQGAAKPESDLTFENYDVSIRTVAHWIKVSKQLLADAPAIAAYIDSRLRDGLAQRIDQQLLIGNGTSPNLSGLTDSGNYTAYTATSDDNLVDAINRAKYTLWALGYVPDTVIVNPADWGAMERTREGAGTGQYLYGAPGMAAGVNPFGVRVVLSSHMPAGSFWIGAIRRAAVLYNREGVAVEMGYVNDDFTKNLITIRAEERLGLGVEVPSATLYGAFTA
jgi:HK97 family phage major capsid protein